MAKAIVKKTDKICWCQGCMAPVGEVGINFDGPYDRKPYCLCRSCFAELTKTMVTVATDMELICTKYDDQKSWCGLKDKRVECQTISMEETQSGEWITRAQATEMFDISRATLDRYRRCGKIQARRTDSTETYKEGYNSFPQGGYLYNVHELEEKFQKKIKNNC